MSGRLKDGGGILDGVSILVSALNGVGIPAMLDNGDATLAVVWVAGVDQGETETPISYITLRQSYDWTEPGGNEDDLGLVYSAITAVLDTTSTMWFPYWGPGSDTTARNVLVFPSSFVALSLGWPES